MFLQRIYVNIIQGVSQQQLTNWCPQIFSFTRDCFIDVACTFLILKSIPSLFEKLCYVAFCVLSYVGCCGMSCYVSCVESLWCLVLHCGLTSKLTCLMFWIIKRRVELLEECRVYVCHSLCA